MTVQSATNKYSYLTHTAAPVASSTTATGEGSSTTAKKTTLGQADFLKLMTTQMTHQDPTKPMENTEFITQMAQFGTVSGIQDLQKSFSEFANSITSSQALQATSLVGRSVSVPGTNGLLSAGGNISGNVNLTESVTNVHLKVTDATTGQIMQETDLGAHGKGNMPFTWDGSTSTGGIANPGVYKIEATALVNGTNTMLETDIDSRVDSVSMGSGANGITVNLTGLDSVNFNQIKQIL